MPADYAMATEEIVRESKAYPKRIFSPHVLEQSPRGGSKARA